MSWVEPESGGAEGVIENPNPEEDSDLPTRCLNGQAEGEVVRLEQERPEDDLAMAVTDPDGDEASGGFGEVTHNGMQGAGAGSSEENQTHVGELLGGQATVAQSDVEQEARGAKAQHIERQGESFNDQPQIENNAQLDNAGGAAIAQIANGVQDTSERVENDEEDSFEQDEETAAPECENSVRLDSTSESDRQSVNSNIQVAANIMVESEITTVSNLNETLLLAGAAVSESERHLCVGNREVIENVIDDSGLSQGALDDEAVIRNIGTFSGNIEVSDSAEDAPEAELVNLQPSSMPIAEAESNAGEAVGISGLPAAYPEGHLNTTNDSSSNHSNPVPQISASEDHDMQAPECDRENSPQPAFSENIDITEAAPLQTASNEHSEQPLGNSVSGNSHYEAIAKLPTNMCQQPNTSDLPCSETVEQMSPQNFVAGSNIRGEECGSNSCSEQSAPNQESGSSLLQQSGAITNHSIPQGSVMTLSESVLPAHESGLFASSSSAPEQGPQFVSAQKKQLSSQVINTASTEVSSAVQTKQEKVIGQKGHNNSSSSISFNASERTSPAKAVAAALFHVMGMDSKFTGKDLARALQSDDEDDLMSELDAELLSSPASLASKPKQDDLARRHHKPKAKQNPRKSSTEVTNGLPSSHDVHQLQEHNRQLLEQLRIRDEEITRLSKKQQSETQDTAQATSSHSPDDLYLPQIKELEKTIAQQGAEIKNLTEKLYTHDAAAKRTVLSLQNEMKARVDQATKMYEDCRREKDMMVVKFAEAEAKNMEAKKMTEKSETKVREAFRERENMANALKAAKVDRQRAISNYDAKCMEVSNMHKELEKMKEAINSAEYRIKWFQNKLKDELEAHKETKGNLEKTNLRLNEAREETELIRKECQAIVKRYQESEEIKSNSLEKDLKLKESELQTHLQERNDSEELHQMLQQELESLKSQHKDTLEEAKTLRDKVKCLEDERQQNHSMIENYQEIMQRQKSDNTDLTSKLNALANLEDDYRRAQNMIQSLDKDISDLKTTNRDLQKDMDSCRERESKMLTLQSELSRANAMLRSENTNLCNKASGLENEVDLLKMQVQQLDQQVKELAETLEKQNEKHQENANHLAQSLAQKTKESNDFKQKWEDEMDNSKTLKRRHANNVKDLTRQLQQTRKKLVAHEGKGDSGSMGSRTNSNGSINSADNGPHHQHGDHHNHNTQTASMAQPQEFPVITEQVEVDKNVLIERIVRLQKSHARKNEKLEFLGEHIQQLLEEIKKKTKIIQSYALREEAGALSSDDMDAHKTLLARKGGIMGSVYSVHQQDGSMTLELSLQINKKLQAVLEDTLLKNITLKDNLDTLGEEIARLSQENRRLQLHLQELEKRPR